MLPLTLLPKDRYPVIATNIYIDAAEPMLNPITPVVLSDWLVSSNACTLIYVPARRIVLDLIQD